MVNQENLYALIALVTPGILRLLMDARGIDEKSAGKLLYNSHLYRLLEDSETRLWRVSYAELYDLLEEELTTGNISNWPEEQG